MLFRTTRCVLTLSAFLLAGYLSHTQVMAQQRIDIDAHAAATPFPHFWETMFGSGRAILSLRESYRDDIRAVKGATDFKYVRFHAILHDEVGVYNEDEHGDPVYNFTYVDEIYDGLLKQHVKPVIEISFMPKKLAFNPDALHPFWYKQNVSPPKSMERWDDLMTHFAQHLIDRYGVAEVSSWYFEVWNEPNIDFWGGIPRMESYFDLYAHTARDLKRVNPRLRVGGPATAAAAWIPDFLQYTSENHVPVDFISTHGYDDEPVERLLGKDQPLRDKDIREEDRVCAGVAHVRQQIDASTAPKLPLLWTEWNVPGDNERRDTPYVGPALAEAIRTCEGVEALSFWTFSDVFEEGGPARKPFEGQFGLRATGGINKASFYDFALLHKLGDTRIASSANDAIVTKASDGSLRIAVWNLADVGKAPQAKSVTLHIVGVPESASVSIERVDEEHSNVLKSYAAMGKPAYPTPAQVEELNRETAPQAPEQRKLSHGNLTLELGKNALLLIHVGP
ncbi:GH39 family glycosyl hydrolase [Granulicella paludicola]|uniref:GH39 family glycosyl hydrolase n=1 Tax=Granulicella paludicola TaxID=474951 RepID=UPI0021DFDC90|nr:glycosyl hydrolase family 39 [Granulicella paludicola]